MNPIITLPATCELCGNWLPGHSTSCPRNGVHPSQWSLGIDELIIQQEESSFVYDEDDTFSSNLNNDEKEETQIKKLSF